MEPRTLLVRIGLHGRGFHFGSLNGSQFSVERTRRREWRRLGFRAQSAGGCDGA
jgi:hypothetical protein